MDKQQIRAMLENTNSTDIAQQAKETSFVKNSISQSLPYMLGFNQPLDGPVGFIFGMKQRQNTSMPGNATDEVITRKFIETQTREIEMDITNEVVEDISRLFGTHFDDNFNKFQMSGGEVWDGPNGPLATFFLYIGMQRMTSKINTDFITWLSQISTMKGTAVITQYSEMAKIYGIIGELREALYKNTKKSGRCWILVSPKIAAFLSSTLGSTMNNSADAYNQGKREVTNLENGYVLTMGDIEVYQYNFYGTPEVTGGTQADTEDAGVIYMGYTGGPGVSSIFYSPYKEYIVQGGEDYQSGQSNIFYRVRDEWSTNPLDTYDKSQSSVILPDGTIPDITKDNKSQFVVGVDITFNEKLIN